MELSTFERRVEAIIFAAGNPIEITKISQALDIQPNIVKHCIERIRERYTAAESPLEFRFLGGAVQLCTKPEYAEDVRAALFLRKSVPLSGAALEVLAVIAYNQPITRAFMEQVRGVDCSGIVRSLVEKGLIEEAGRLQVPGKPIAYRTTQVFLRSFGLEGIHQLPELPGSAESGGQPSGRTPEIEGQLDFTEMP